MKEADIRPAGLHDEYIRLSRLDAERIFSTSSRESIVCPGCLSPERRTAFSKFGFEYQECANCASLYQSPRPVISDFERFYENSESAVYWAKEFFPKVAEARRELIVRPRARRILEICNERKVKVVQLIDVGAGTGLFIEEWKNLVKESSAAGIEPGEELAALCRSKGIEILQTTVEKAKAWKNRAELVTCFEVFEHAPATDEFLRSLYDLVKPGGLLVLTSLGADGFDIRTLGADSKSVSPPHHINFLSVKGFEAAFVRAGFSEVDVFTPGKLDADIVINHMKAHPEFEPPEHFKKTVAQGEAALKQFQLNLVERKQSSHVWVVAKKQEGIL